MFAGNNADFLGRHYWEPQKWLKWTFSENLCPEVLSPSSELQDSAGWASQEGGSHAGSVDGRWWSVFLQHKHQGRWTFQWQPCYITAHFPQVIPDWEPLTEGGGVQDPARREVSGRDPKAISSEHRCKLEAERLNKTPGVNLKAKWSFI